MKALTLALLPWLAVIAGSAFGSEKTDWPQWRGPHFDGTSTETGLPLTFGEAENLEWKQAMPGRSGSTPIVVGDRIYLTVALEDDTLEAWALDASDGKIVWKRPLGGGNFFRMKHNMSSPSPVSDGDKVWVMAGTGVIKAFDRDGKELWARNLQVDYGAFGLNHGYGASPLLADGVLYVPVLHGMTTDDPSYVVAIDAATGSNVWRVERPTDALMESPDAYTTPVLWDRGGTQELIVTGGDYVTGHDLESGRELWRVGGMNPDKAKMYRVVASPVVSGEMLMVPSRVRPLMGLSSTGAGTAPDVAWKIDKATDVPTPSVHEGLLYVLTDRGLLSVWDVATGEAVYGPERLETGTYSASPLVADGKLYAVSEESAVTVVKLGREFEVLAVNELEGYSLASPVAAAGRLFLRTDRFLYSFDEP
ncbi:MAG: PQQ-binding-like beta-propeller repeat protein [Acidobacteriota bacterium]